MEWLIVSTWLIMVVNLLAYFLGSSSFVEFCCLPMTSRFLMFFLALLSLFILVRGFKQKCLACKHVFKFRGYSNDFLYFFNVLSEIFFLVLMFCFFMFLELACRNPSLGLTTKA